MTTPLNNKKGTTLVELMVCLVLLALFGVAAVTLVKPSAEAYISVQQLTRAQNLADALTETIRGELANADGTLAILPASEDDATADTVLQAATRATEGTALRFTVTTDYFEVLDAGYVPKLEATVKNADKTTTTKTLYDPADTSLPRWTATCTCAFTGRLPTRPTKRSPRNIPSTPTPPPTPTVIIWGWSSPS